MGLIKEPLDVDFEVEPKALTQKEKEAISQYILDYKTKQAKKHKRKTTAVRKKVNNKPKSKKQSGTF
jgi:hypothetical protein